MRKYSLFLVIVLFLALPVTVIADSHRTSMPYTDYDPLSGDGLTHNSWCRLGQVITIPGRYITSVGYNVWKIGTPTGNVTLSIYNVTTNEVIFSKAWGDATNLTTWGSGPSPIEVVFNNPTCINGTVRICVEYYGGDQNNYCGAGYYTGDRITGEWYTNYRYGQWHDIGEAEEGAYFYTWIDPEDLILNPTVPPLWPIAPASLAIGALLFYVNRKQRKKYEYK